MKSLKPLLAGLVLGILVGLWFGVNIGKGRPFYSNPFAATNVGKEIKSSIGEGVERAGESIEKLGGDIKGKPDSQ